VASAEAQQRAPGRASAVLRVVGALIATLPAALLAAVCVARWLPGDAELRLMLGLTLAIPLWLFAMCRAFLVRNGVRVWLWCGAAALVFGGLAYGMTS